MFSADNEKMIIEKEKEWFEMHTHYSLENCVQDAESSGFRGVYWQEEGRKLFLYVGKAV